MPTGGVTLDTPSDLIIERQLLLDDTTQNVDKFGISNRGEHNVVVLDQLTSPLRREFGNSWDKLVVARVSPSQCKNSLQFDMCSARSMKSLNGEAVDLEAGTDDKERDKQARSIKLVKDPNQALLSGLAYCISSCSMILINKYVLSSYDFNAGISLMLYQLTLRRVMDTAKQVTKSGNLNEFTMVLLNNTLSLPLGLLLIFLFNEVDYLFET
ncbi:hypothetical protein C5167_009757 [Papaver somniferum]|uniref:Sugar phosphate transporter domain-containing protein n=1 Tax=Papaver somniferum TaxID=3469 RepID=A0A4Y7K1D9_PAPSO|nr:hypothetical protein C5167_009757 [Papaver somniferum]